MHASPTQISVVNIPAGTHESWHAAPTTQILSRGKSREGGVARCLGQAIVMLTCPRRREQARRTGSSSPLGELFDHGCDAISTFVTVTGCLCVCQTDYTVGAFAALIFSLMAFQGAHIQTYYKGILFFGLIDVAEAQVWDFPSPCLVPCLLASLNHYAISKHAAASVASFRFDYSWDRTKPNPRQASKYVVNPEL